ncbi:acetate--CoA ligase family protein [Chloroflexota bacterium]
MKSNILDKLYPIFYPRALAIVGVSEVAGNSGLMYLQSLISIGFPKIYLVNPQGGTILGLTVYPNVKDIPDEVDLAIIATPKKVVPVLVRECSEKGVKGLIIHTAGFSETGAEGKKLEEQIVAIAREYGVYVIGPNCMGVYNPAARITMAGWKPISESGSLGIISHSGFMPYISIEAATDRGMRLSKVISSGNESDLNSTDFLNYLGQDPQTKIILAYLEGIKEGRRFFQIAREVSLRKPIIVWKGGMTEDGIKASASHTGSISTSANVWRALCKQAGLISVNSAEEAIDTVEVFYRLPKPKGRKVGIISSPGVFAVTCSDACKEAGLKLADFSPETIKRLTEVIAPVGTSNKNPVDVGMPGSHLPEFYYKKCFEIVDKDPEVEMLFLIMTNLRNMDFSKQAKVADILFKTIKSSNKPVVISIPSPQSLPQGYGSLLAQKGVPVYGDPRRAIGALGKLSQYAEFIDMGEV